jgi:hypothetical protein
MLSKIAEKVINVYGGADLWQKSKYIEAVVSAKGLLFTLKRRPHLKNAKLFLDIHRTYAKCTPIGNDPNISGIFDNDVVRLEDESGNIISSRENPRQYFPYGKRLLKWDDLDMSYFSNYAFWNYLTFPNLMLNNEIEWNEKVNGRLEAIFPNHFPTHSRKQEFFFDIETARLKQHNYTAEVVSSLATAANIIKEHKTENGILYPSKRVITPQSKKKGYLNKPILVDIEIHSFKFY